jgi:hypothetical protein
MIFQSVLGITESIGDERIPGNVRNYPQCERSCTAVGSKDSRFNEEYYGVSRIYMSDWP